jgi:hypothetical protein
MGRRGVPNLLAGEWFGAITGWLSERADLLSPEIFSESVRCDARAPGHRRARAADEDRRDDEYGELRSRQENTAPLDVA